jgi:hypothetical protein
VSGLRVSNVDWEGATRPSASVRGRPRLTLVVRRPRRPCVVRGRPRPAARPSMSRGRALERIV